MIASMLKLNRSDCKALNITDPYSIHRVVYELFPGETRNFLFADKGGDFNTRQILILSEHNPKAPQFGEIESKPIPNNFLEYDHYGFEVMLNPTKRDKQTGKTVAIRGCENLIRWFLNKALILGFEIMANSLEIRNSGVQIFDLGNDKIVTHNRVTFVGKLKVTDRIKFQNSFVKGIGRAKGFGFGLFQIIPLDTNLPIYSQQGD
ncbi:type I-E CRISPR-associated protein Cas6/Cse3/CasE [candidate division WOR-3 bacterium]|nr:type I-E CRISPR-associated protein Cas6/Cse3/CasE [candidate division WOR-3 bacterium]